MKNYTSSIPVDRSIAFIESKLAAFGARSIMKEYTADGKPCSLAFILEIEGRPIPFQLPARIDEAFTYLKRERDRKASRPLSEAATETMRLQAERSAWKLLSDWVEIQLSLIELRQLRLFEAFLAFAYDPASRETFYQKLERQKFKALLPAANPNT